MNAYDLIQTMEIIPGENDIDKSNKGRFTLFINKYFICQWK